MYRFDFDKLQFIRTVILSASEEPYYTISVPVIFLLTRVPFIIVSFRQEASSGGYPTLAECLQHVAQDLYPAMGYGT